MKPNDAHKLLSEAGQWHSRAAFERYHRVLFEGVDFNGRRVLDVGGGIGACSFWSALSGADEVICLEPERAGAKLDTAIQFGELAGKLGLANVTLRDVTLQELDAAPESFDVIILNNSINHLDEQACVTLLSNKDAQEQYRSIFEQIACMTRSQGDLIISDCTPYNLFPWLGLRHPISKSIEWHKHQTPEFWAKELERVGFERPAIRWTSYSRLGKLGWRLTANRLLAFFLTGHFILKMKRSMNDVARRAA